MKKVVLVSIFCMVMLSGCVTAHIEMRQTTEVKDDPKGPSVSSSLTFVESW